MMIKIKGDVDIFSHWTRNFLSPFIISPPLIYLIREEGAAEVTKEISLYRILGRRGNPCFLFAEGKEVCETRLRSGYERKWRSLL
jgi:hypothetical protein